MIVRHSYSWAKPGKWPYRAMNLVLAAAVLLPVACTRTWQYSKSHVLFCAVEGDSFYAVVERETGTASRTTPAPCPKTTPTPQHLYLYRLTYSLAHSPSPPQKSEAIEFPLQDRRAEVRLGDGEHVPQELVACKQLQVPRTASLFTCLTPNVKLVEADALPDREAESLQRMGFRTKRVACYADPAGGRWYLGFDPFSPGVQVCCPKKNILRERQLQGNFGAIWDVSRSRLVLPEEDTGWPLVGLPRAVTVWSYDRDTLESVELLPATVHD